MKAHRIVVLLWVLCVVPRALAADTRPTTAALVELAKNTPQLIASDGAINLTFGEERIVLPRGLQPSMLVTRSSAIILQAQVPEKPFPSNRMTYPYAMSTRISRDRGLSWIDLPLKPGENGLNMEGGIVQLRDGTILALDTYITPGERPDIGVGQLYSSDDDWRTVSGPQDVTFELPGIDWESKDDGGRPHRAQRLHRRILELPGGDLLTTFYGRMKGDDAPCTYIPTMKKSRTMLARSSDRGRHWKLIATIAVDPAMGTEGFGEPVICRVSKGPSAGRLICLMRTGRELRESVSDDDGATWSPPAPRVFADLDVYKTEQWVEMFRDLKNKGRALDENNPEDLRGAVVDPDLIELRSSGILVAAFGVRIPQKMCWRRPDHPWNGNYLAFSRDHGQTWTNVVRLTSGVLTTHYMAIEETPRDNEIYVTYDLGGWSNGMRRDVVGRTVTLASAPPDVRTRCYDVLIGALKDESQWVRAHAAEALVLSKRPEPALDAFRPLADTADAKYRIVVWRILAQAEPQAAARRDYVERIRCALFDRNGPDQTHAMEALAKLREPASDQAERAVVREIADGGGPAAPFAVWRLAQANDAAAADHLLTLIRSADAVTRARAAYVVSRIGPLPDAGSAAIADACASEPADSPARVMLRVAQGAEAAREMLLDAHGSAEGRYVAAMCLAERGTADDRQALARLLEDSDADVRVAAAFAFLRLSDRLPSPASRP